VKRLEALATNEKETQGKSTIGDEKVKPVSSHEWHQLIITPQKYNVFMRVSVSHTLETDLTST
jgi:ABC-type branched-subunit amino acid transport system ATPase component